MPRYLVTGAAGFIGSNLAKALEAQGAEVVALDALRSGSLENLKGFRGQFVQGDVSQADVEGPWNGILHHGDITDPRHASDDEVMRTNLGGFDRVLEWSLQSSCPLVYASTAGLYGNGPVPMNEDQTKHCLTAYGVSKLKMDEKAQRLGAEAPIVGLRYFNVFGPAEAAKGRAASMVYHLYKQLRAGHPPRLFEHGEQKRDFIYVKDVVQANLLALRAPSGVYNVGTGIATSFADLAKALCEAMGIEREIEYFPMPYDASTYQACTQADTSLARDRLGFSAQWDLKTALQDYVAWLDSEYSPGNVK